MTTFKRIPGLLNAALAAFIVLLLPSRPVSAQPFTNVTFFAGSIALDGDISDFFMPDGVTARPGVCVVNDSFGLDEAPLSASATRDAVAHPSGFNQIGRAHV